MYFLEEEEFVRKVEFSCFYIFEIPLCSSFLRRTFQFSQYKVTLTSLLINMCCAIIWKKNLTTCYILLKLTNNEQLKLYLIVNTLLFNLPSCPLSTKPFWYSVVFIHLYLLNTIFLENITRQNYLTHVLVQKLLNSKKAGDWRGQWVIVKFCQELENVKMN